MQNKVITNAINELDGRIDSLESSSGESGGGGLTEEQVDEKLENLATVDKIQSINTSDPDMGAYDLVVDNGLKWEDDMLVNEVDGGYRQISMLYSLPIVAGDNVTIVADEDNGIFKINATGGSGGLTEMEIDDKIANALIEAPLSNSQYMEAFEMIETNVPLHLEANMEGYLANAGAVLLNGSAWLETQDKIQALENKKLHRVTGTAFEQFYGDDGQGKECRFECVCKFPTRWGQDFLHSLYDRQFYDCGVISFRLLPPADNSFYPLHEVYNSSDDMGKLVGFNSDGTFYGGATLSGNAFRVVVSVKDVVVEEIPATDNEE